MYDDYKVVYESKLNEYLIFWIIFGIVALILLAIVLISTSRVLKKAGRSPILGLIPIYNLIPSLEITNMEKKYFIPLIIPIVNVPFWLMLNIELAKFFKKSKTFGIGLTALPFIFYPILAFGDSEYMGINLVAMDSTNTVENIPMIDDEKNTLIEKEINDQIDTPTNTSNISLGGGKYQKEYKKSLLTVEDDMIARGEIQKTKPNDIITNGKFFNSGLIGPEQTNNNQQETHVPANGLFNVSFINGTQTQPQTSVNQNVQPSVNKPTISMPNASPAPIQTQPQTPTPSKPTIQMSNINNSVNQNVNTQIPIQQAQNSPSNNQPVDLLKSNAQAAPQSGPKLCPNCGTRVADNARICMICGQKL